MARIVRRPGTPKVMPREVYDARTDAKRIVEDAKARASQTVGAAQQEASEIRKEARHQGLLEARAQTAAQLLQAGKAYEAALAAAEADAVDLALTAAKKIIGEELLLSPERMRAIVRDLLERTPRAKKVCVRVHPADASILEDGPKADRRGYQVEEDESVTRGGCVVSSDLGEMDARIEVQLEALAMALRK